MAVIGKFTPAKDSGWVGTVRTLTINAKVRLVPNDDRGSNKAPAFRVFVGGSRIGEAWETRTGGVSPKEYLRAKLDDPMLPEPMNAAMFASDSGDSAQMFLSRRRSEDQRATRK